MYKHHLMEDQDKHRPQTANIDRENVFVRNMQACKHASKLVVPFDLILLPTNRLLKEPFSKLTSISLFFFLTLWPQIRFINEVLFISGILKKRRRSDPDCLLLLLLHSTWHLEIDDHCLGLSEPIWASYVLSNYCSRKNGWMASFCLSVGCLAE